MISAFYRKKARLRAQLNDFRKYYKALLESGVFIQLSPFYNVCYLAMNESISFIEGLIKFVDETFEQYKRTKYGEDKVWHVVTRLATKLIEEVAKPRIGMEHAFNLSNYVQMAEVIFYTSPRSLDVMMDIKAHDFIDSPLIASELTQFLAMNTDFELTQSLDRRICELQEENSELNRKFQEASKPSNNFLNKFDTTYKKQLEKSRNVLRLWRKRNEYLGVKTRTLPIPIP